MKASNLGATIDKKIAELTKWWFQFIEWLTLIGFLYFVDAKTKDIFVHTMLIVSEFALVFSIHIPIANFLASHCPNKFYKLLIAFFLAGLITFVCVQMVLRILFSFAITYIN